MRIIPKKKNIDDVYELFEWHNLNPEFIKYENSNTPLQCKNNDGYTIMCRVSHLVQYKRNQKIFKPSVFNVNNKHTLNNIRLWLTKENINLKLSDKNKTYKGNKELMLWECLSDSNHEPFYKNFSCIYDGNYCKECSSKKKSEDSKVPYTVFMRRLRLKRGNTIEIISNYDGMNKHLTIKDKYGECSLKPSDLLKHTPTINSAINKTAYFINKAKEIHSDRYKYNKSHYVNKDEYLTITCREHGDFEISPTFHLSGGGCKICSSIRKGRVCGLYSKHTAYKNKEKWDKINSQAYVIKLNNNTEKFYKIGTTKNDISDRLSSFPYKCELLFNIKISLYNAIFMEKELHNIHKDRSYIPKIKFGGYTECFSELNSESINSIISKYN